LKGVEGDSWRENDANQRVRNVVQAEIVQHACERPGKEIKIFEDSENGEIQNQ